MRCENRVRCDKYDEMDCMSADYKINCPEYRSYIRWLNDATKLKPNKNIWSEIDWEKVSEDNR